MDKKTARYIWNCIENHSGDFSEDRSEWCYALDIDVDDLDKFIELVNVMIDVLPDGGDAS